MANIKGVNTHVVWYGFINSESQIAYIQNWDYFLTCCNIFWSCITSCAHDLCRNMGSIPSWTCFCQAKVWKLGIELLHRGEKKLGKEKSGVGGFTSLLRTRVSSHLMYTESRRMFDALKSRYMTWFSASCRNDKPLAAPIATLSLIPQGKGSAPPKRMESFCWTWGKV